MIWLIASLTPAFLVELVIYIGFRRDSGRSAESGVQKALGQADPNGPEDPHGMSPHGGARSVSILATQMRKVLVWREKLMRTLPPTIKKADLEVAFL